MTQLTRAEQTHVREQLGSLIPATEMAELLNLVFPSHPVAARTPMQWDFRYKRGEMKMPMHVAAIGKTRRPLWMGADIVEWYAERNGLRISQWVMKAIKGVREQ